VLERKLIRQNEKKYLDQVGTQTLSDVRGHKDLSLENLNFKIKQISHEQNESDV
jgi:hypothetical protein